LPQLFATPVVSPSDFFFVFRPVFKRTERTRIPMWQPLKLSFFALYIFSFFFLFLSFPRSSLPCHHDTHYFWLNSPAASLARSSLSTIYYCMQFNTGSGFFLVLSTFFGSPLSSFWDDACFLSKFEGLFIKQISFPFEIAGFVGTCFHFIPRPYYIGLLFHWVSPFPFFRRGQYRVCYLFRASWLTLCSGSGLQETGDSVSPSPLLETSCLTLSFAVEPRFSFSLFCPWIIPSPLVLFRGPFALAYINRNVFFTLNASLASQVTEDFCYAPPLFPQLPFHVDCPSAGSHFHLLLSPPL